MISEKDRDTITRLAREYDVSRVTLFGSSSVEGREAQDIDIGVRGVKPRLFFRLYGELLMQLSKPVDLINLDHHSRFTQLVERRGVAIYG